MIYAITVSYNPLIQNLTSQFEKLLPQVDKIILIDNGSKNQNEIQNSINQINIQLKLLSENIGIAGAQNIGIKIAEEEGADYVIFFDQDSFPEEKLVLKLSKISENHEILDNKLNMVGPVSQDMRTGRKSFFLVKKSLGFKNQFCQDINTDVILCNFLISSGSIIPIKIFQKIGNFRDDFFIDHVDTEFCIRMKNAGFKIYGTCSTKIYHNLGDRIQKIWMGRWREVSIHSPLRNYYISRNTFYMIFYMPMDILWRIRLLKRVLYYFLYSILFTSSRITRIQYFLLGLKDGLFKKLGKIKID